MGHYFAFVKDAGKHLDPKTRNLISVITKVHAQTERGFRQYLGRALREGCTPMEVLDALLMAFPALGLAKIIWAVDIILAMDIPEFRPDVLLAERRWHDVMASSDVADGQVLRLDCDGRGLFVHRAGGVFRSTTAAVRTRAPTSRTWRCTAPRLTCPKHQWKFDITTGDCIDKGDSPLTRLESRVRKGRLQVLW